MKIHQLFLIFSLIASASIHGMEKQEQQKSNAYFKSSGYSNLKTTFSQYKDDCTHLFPHDKPKEWPTSACLCCVLCPCVVGRVVAENCCPISSAASSNTSSKMD